MPSHESRPLVLLAVALVTLAFVLPSPAAEQEQQPPKLLGRCQADELGREPFAEWFREVYDDYAPNPEIVAELRKADLGGVQVVKLFEVNGSLYRDSAASWARLADALLLAGNVAEAREAAEQALRLNEDDERVAELIELLGRTREPAASGDEDPP